MNVFTLGFLNLKPLLFHTDTRHGAPLTSTYVSLLQTCLIYKKLSVSKTGKLASSARVTLAGFIAVTVKADVNLVSLTAQRRPPAWLNLRSRREGEGAVHPGQVTSQTDDGPIVMSTLTDFELHSLLV